MSFSFADPPRATLLESLEPTHSLPASLFPLAAHPTEATESRALSMHLQETLGKQ